VRVRLALAAAALAATAAAVLAAPPSAPVRVTIVHTNDLHGHVENAAAIAAVARAEKAKNPHTLFLDAGDSITGTPMSTVFKGEPVFEIMSLMGYDAATLGNHEFDHGWKQIARFRQLAVHPLLNANAAAPDGKPFGDDPWRVFTVGGVRIGVIGLLTADMKGLVTTANWEGCTVEPPLEAAKRLVPEVRKKCDVVVLLTHIGVEADTAIAGAVPGIDLVVGGHSHTEIKEPLSVACGDAKVAVVQAGRYGACAGVVEFEWVPAEKAVRKLEGRLVRIDREKMPNAADVRELVEQWQARTEAKQREAGGVALTDVIGKAPGKLTKEKLCAAIERIYAEALGADFGFQNLHGVRAEIAAGDIRAADVWNVLPFENSLVKIRVKGDQVPPYVKKRLGDKFDAAKEYTIATNSYVGDQQRKYFRVEGLPVEDTGLPMRETVVAWVKKHGGFGEAPDDPGHGEDSGEKKK
jgi:2',3'-cyclic-nucleotide 2'-phosphodiesterase (5'-nucleotidase family)